MKKDKFVSFIKSAWRYVLDNIFYVICLAIGLALTIVSCSIGW